MDITIQEFLRRKGAIGLLSLLHERPMTYSEIQPEIEVTSDTIIRRRDEAAELGLLNISLGEGDVGTKKVYHLTDMGEALTQQMAQTGLISSYRKMRTLEQLVDEQTDEVVRWVGNNPAQLLTFEEAIDGTIIQDSSQSTSSETNDPNPTGEKANESTDQPEDEDTDDTEIESTETHGDEPSHSTGADEDTENRTTTSPEAISEEEESDSGDNESRPQRPSASFIDELDGEDASNMDQQNLADIGSEEGENDNEDSE